MSSHFVGLQPSAGSLALPEEFGRRRETLISVTRTVTIVTNMVTDVDPLSKVLLGKIRGAILALLYSSPDGPLHVRRIARLTGLGLGPTQRELQVLARVGVIKRQEVGQHVFYSPDPACPVHEELRALVQKTVGIEGVLRRALRPLAGEIRIALLFGSFARGQQRAASDIDVLVIGDASFRAVAGALLEPQRQLKREINPMVYRPAEFAAKWRAGHPFVNAVMAGPKAFLVGGEDELSTMAEERLATTTSAHAARNRRPARRRRA
jgi:predicted nucleotidyltransferase